MKDNSRVMVLASSFILAVTVNTSFAKEVVLDAAVKSQIKAFAKLSDEKKAQIGFCDEFVLGKKLVGKGQLKPFLREMNSQLRKVGKKPIRCNKNLRRLPEAKGQDRFLKTKEVSYESSEGYSQSELKGMKTVKTMTVPQGTVIPGPTFAGAGGATGGVALGGVTSGILGGGLGSAAALVGGAALATVVYNGITKKGITKAESDPLSGGNSSF